MKKLNVCPSLEDVAQQDDFNLTEQQRKVLKEIFEHRGGWFLLHGVNRKR